jgi:anti-repressor protein
MTNLSVIEQNGILVVDSRLITERLAIKHKNFLATIEKYLRQIESSFGAVAFQTREFKTRQGNISVERFAFLTEDQATFLMTLSRNTEQVVECKLALVQAFSKAKQVIKTVVPAQTQEIERLKLELDLAKTQERLLATTNAFAKRAGGNLATLHGSDMLALMMGKPDAIVTRTERVETLVAVDGKGHAREAPPPLRERFFRWGWDYISCQEIWLREKYLCLSLLAQNRWSIRRTVDNRTDIGQVPKVAEGFITVARSPTRSQGGN